jgi:sugar phosphate isomerase/epimerase
MLLIDVVRVLQVRGHPVNTIELVSGSRIKSISREPGSASTCFVHRLTQSTAMSLLISRLKEVAAYAYRPTPVFLAVELEPGPLFILSSPNSVTRFCKLIDDSKDEALKRCVGLNLDIPHWHFLAGILPEWLEAPENKAVYRRIAHAHICDHHIGHFCDLVPMTFNSKGTFLRWFSFLHQLSSEKRPVGLPKFSRFVSCEMEACTDKRLVQNCYQRVSELLAYNSATTRPKVVSRNQIARRAEA